MNWLSIKPRQRRFAGRVALGGLCVLGVMVLLVWACGLLPAGESDAEERADAPPHKDARNLNNSVRAIPLYDTTDLSSLSPLELAGYLQDVKMGRRRRKLGEVESEVRKLATEEISRLCRAFRETKAGEPIRALATTLGLIGTDEAVKTLVTYYYRNLPPHETSDYGIACAIGKSGNPDAAALLIDACKVGNNKRLRKRLLVGMSRIKGSEAITDFLIRLIPGIRDRGELYYAMECLGAVGCAGGVKFLEKIARDGAELECDDAEQRALYAISLAKSETGTTVLAGIALDKSVPLKRRIEAVSYIGGQAKRGCESAVAHLEVIALSGDESILRGKATEGLKRCKPAGASGETD